MNVLKRKLMLSFLGKEPSPSRFEVCDRMRPYLRQYGLRLTGEGILFPEKWSDSQYLLWLIYACPLYRREIPFGAVVRLLETPDGLHLMLRTGHVFYFAAGGRRMEYNRCVPVWRTLVADPSVVATERMDCRPL